MTPAEQFAAQKKEKAAKVADVRVKRPRQRLFRNTLKELRNAVGLTRKDIADAVGVNRSCLCLWENGCNISLDNALKLAKFYGKTVEEIFQLLDDAEKTS